MSFTERFRRRRDSTAVNPLHRIRLKTSTGEQPVIPAAQCARRSEAVLDAVRRLDAKLDADACRKLAEWLAAEYDTAYGDVPVGLFAVCHLGPPYVDHRMALVNAVLEHYAPGDRVPEPFDGARMLVRSGDYAYAEVYASGLVLPVRNDGAVVRP
jgi:hypothetical protein